MGEKITIKLKKPLISPEGEVHQIILREPTFDEYLTEGDPYTIAASNGGIPFMVENADVIKRYMTICVVEPKDPAILLQCNARVAKEMKERFLSFFRPDVADGEG